MFYLNRGRILDEGVQKQLTSFLVGPVLWNGVSLGVQILQDSFDVLVLSDHCNSSSWSNVFDRVAVIASKQNAQIDELFVELDRLSETVSYLNIFQL